MTDIERLLRGVDTVLPEGELEERLSEGVPLRIKLGVDPTASTVTLGWAVVLRKLRQFQELGHTAVLIVGDFTAQVGDPSGTSETRRRLSQEEVAAHAEAVIEGLHGVLLSESLEVRYNSEWLAELDMADVLELTSRMTVARTLEREDFGKRYAANQPISVMELLYPLLQAMDSVAIDADLELGGTDQLWNLLVGRDIMGRYGKRPQMVMTVPLLVGSDGEQKMSQSLGNYIGVDDEPDDMFGKVMSVPDSVMGEYFLLATDVEETEIESIVSGLANDTLHPGETKRRLAREIVAIYHGASQAEESEAAFNRLFRDHETPDEVSGFPLTSLADVWLPEYLHRAGLIKSNSEGRRLIEQGAVKVDGRRVESETWEAGDLLGLVIQVGKRRFVRVEPPTP